MQSIDIFARCKFPARRLSKCSDLLLSLYRITKSVISSAFTVPKTLLDLGLQAIDSQRVPVTPTAVPQSHETVEKVGENDAGGP
jgi:hypothetical protein